MSVRPRLAGALGLLSAAATLAGATPTQAQAQGRLEARYEVTLAGIPLGKGGWVVEIADDKYSASADGGTTGLMKILGDGKGTSAAQGRIANGSLIPASYAFTTTTSRKTESIHMALAGGNVRDFSIEPEPKDPNPRVIPLTEAHRRGVQDPMTASLIQTPGNGDPVAPEACRNVSVFDGRMRYDLKLTYKRMEKVKAHKGYEGPVVVCAIHFVPIAGYDPTRAAIKYLIAQKNMEVWLAPVAGTRVVVPFRVNIPTPIGTGVLFATDFVTTAVPHEKTQ